MVISIIFVVVLVVVAAFSPTPNECALAQRSAVNNVVANATPTRAKF